MTTQDTHQEYDDVDASVVEHPSTPEHETTVDSLASELMMPVGTHEVEGNLSPESILPAEDEHQVHQEAPASSEAGESTATPEIPIEAQETPTVTLTTAIEDAAEVQEAPSALDTILEVADIEQTAPVVPGVEASSEPLLATIDGPVVEHSASIDATEVEPQAHEVHTDALSTEHKLILADLSSALSEVLSTMEPVSESETIHYREELVSSIKEEHSSALSEEASSLVDSKVEEVRPFTDFIAEFRQAEAALRDSQVEALSILSSGTADLTFVEAQAEEITVFEEVKRSDAAVAADKEDGVQVKMDVVNVSNPSELQSSAPDVQAEVTNIVEKSAPQPTIRPVSPLLRPASRLRIPRHGVTRHQREEANSENQASAETPPLKVEPVSPPPASAEPVAELTPPRPARRYRFDRPATLNNGSANGSSPAPVTVDSPQSATLNGAIQHPEETNVAFTAKVEAVQPASEQPVEPQTIKPAVQEIESPAPTTAIDHSRRRHNSHKEPPVAAQVTQPVAEPVVQAPEPVVPLAEIAPEDLPPLEYSELQKVSSRRRRRHRSGSTSVASAPAIPANSQPVVPVVPVVPVAPTVVPPPAPVVPVPVVPLPTPVRSVASEPSQSSYTIVSGYTVNQMNQGNDLSGPFMAPDPSPARGSVVTRDGRAVRAETRTAQPAAPVYPPSRPMENGLSTAAMTQFANIVSQALQTQTDRMVSEFRRIGQSPTNVSVTLPPFPSTERVGVFVDVANLLYSARTLRIGVDFGKLLDFLRGNRRLVRAHAYCPTSPQPGDEQMFLQAVKGLGYRITTKNYKTFSSGAKKADLDLDLCMDVVRLVDGGAVDCVVLVSGDSDFMPMLDYCSDHGVRVEVAAFDEAMSATLRQSCDLFINLSMLDDIRA